MTSSAHCRLPDGADAVTVLGHEIARLHRTHAHYRAALTDSGPDGLEWSAYMLLGHLVRNGRQRLSALAGIAHIDPSTVSRQVGQLVTTGLAQRKPDPQDGRATLLSATPEGHATFDRMCGLRDQALAVVVRDWSPDDVETLATLLTSLNDSLAGTLGELMQHLKPDLKPDTTQTPYQETA